jgi:predicted SprT family Zn-dependent metalloprotease
MPSRIANQIKLFHHNATRELWIDLLDTWPLPTFDITDSIGDNAAFCEFDNNHLLFNPKYYYANCPDFLFESVGHEMAHLIAFQLYGDRAANKPHGRDWRYVMIVMGIPLRIHHNYTRIYVPETEEFTCVCGKITCRICKKTLAINNKTANVPIVKQRAAAQSNETKPKKKRK